MTCTETNFDQFRFCAAKRLCGMSAYVPPKKLPFVDLFLDANEGAVSSDVFRELLDGFPLEELRRYPSMSAVEGQLAREFGLDDAARVVLTNGADDAIDRVCRFALEPGRELLLHTPTFEMIERSARLAGGGVRTVKWMDGRFPVREFIGAISETTALVSLVSPNNPTGGAIGLEDMLEVVRAARRVGALVLIDLAYVEFADVDPTRVLIDEPSVVVVRTFSKARGLAGARVGYAVASVEISELVRAAGGPYPVSSVSAALAGASLRFVGERTEFIETVRAERAALADLLQELGCEVLESHANFVTASFSDALFVQRALASLGIGVRGFPSRAGLERFLRITVPGDRAGFDRLRCALRTSLDPQVLLFDLDGVLADVSRSYRMTMIETAREFGVVLNSGDIGAAKRAGGANNDWELTKRLIEQLGVACELEDVIARFQHIYEGRNGQPGLRETERLIPDLDVLCKLRERYVLGVVTGRPRSEAEWFLDRSGLRELFSTLVCMEDAPAKPSPEPVLLALRALDMDRAWMIGDTPDDIVAARLSRVLPVGVIAPGDAPGEDSESLWDCGAAAVLSDLSELEGVIQ